MVTNGLLYSETPTYLEFVRAVVASLSECWKKFDFYDVTPNGLWAAVQKYGSCTLNDVIAVAVGAVLWTLLRIVLFYFIFVPIAKFSKLELKMEKKVPEYFWRLLFSVTNWTYTAYLVLYKYELFSNPAKTAKEWEVLSDVPNEIYLAYLLQISFYCHAVYASIFWDVWRKDSLLIVIHHFASIILLGSSYMFNFTRHGLLVLFCHDYSDTILAATKLTLYYKTKGGQFGRICGKLTNIGFVLFTASWFLFRLYWFPLKAIYAITFLSPYVNKELVFTYGNGIVLLLVLMGMHIYWFKLMVETALNLATGKVKEVLDPREYDNNVQNKGKANGKVNGTSNGVTNNNHHVKQQ